MRFEEMNKENMSDAARIFAEYYNQVVGGIWTEAIAYKRIYQAWKFKNSYGTVLYDNGKAIAFAIGFFNDFDPGLQFEVIELIVSPEYRRRGVGTLVIDEMKSMAADKGAIDFCFEVHFGDENRRFYGGMGFGMASRLSLDCMARYW